MGILFQFIQSLIHQQIINSENKTNLVYGHTVLGVLSYSGKLQKKVKRSEIHYCTFDLCIDRCLSSRTLGAI